MQVAELIKKINANEVTIEQLLAPPGSYLKDIPLDSLRIDVLPSGFPSLDDYMLLKSTQPELIVVGGRPSMGKSAFMFQLALEVSSRATVYVASLEMSKEQVLTRLISGLIDVPISMIQRGLCKPKDLERAKAELAKYDFIIDDRAGLNIGQLCQAIKERHAKEKLGLVIIDYLQLLRVEKGHSKDDEVGSITRSLKELAKDLRVPVVVGSQLNRQNESRGASSGNYRPLLSDLRESGNIEQDADLVLFVHRESRYTGQRPEEADIIVAKNRNGAVGDVVMSYVPTQTKFIDRGASGI